MIRQGTVRDVELVKDCLARVCRAPHDGLRMRAGAEYLRHTTRVLTLAERMAALFPDCETVENADAPPTDTPCTNACAVFFVNEGDDGFAIVRAYPSGLAEVEELSVWAENSEKHDEIAGVLLCACAEWATKLACDAIDWQVLPGDRSSKSVGEALGFKARSITMHQPLLKTTAP